MVFQTKASGTFREDHWYFRHIYLITAFNYSIFQNLERKKRHDVTETR
jgi:hypothetical protein